jgi:hypothetical protein
MILGFWEELFGIIGAAFAGAIMEPRAMVPSTVRPTRRFMRSSVKNASHNDHRYV